MIGLGWSQDQVDQVSPERRARLLWGLHARRLVALRDTVLGQPIFSDEAKTQRDAQLLAIDVRLFPLEPPSRVT